MSEEISIFPKISRLTLVCPVYNEAKAIPDLLNSLDSTLSDISDLVWDIVFVNDGSQDNSLQIMRKEAEMRNNVTILDLSRNFGKEAALTAGLEEAKGDAVVPIDVDLQDPPDLIPEMLMRWREGWEVVVAKRIDRSTDSAAKRISVRWFYSLMNQISKPQLPQDIGDFRLLDRKVVEVLRSLPERRRFMKGLFAWAGFKTFEVTYSRPERSNGETKFSAWKLWNLAIEGITSA